MSEAICAVLGMVFAGLAVLGIVRLVNRRKSLGRRFWIAAAIFVVLAGYPLSLGPWVAFYVALHDDRDSFVVPFAIYRPIEFVACNSPAKSAFQRYILWWARLGAPSKL